VKELGYITIGHREASVPFSYLDDKRQPVGFAIDICAKIVDAVKRELKLDKLEVRYQLVTASTRIPLLANGTIDLECGNTTNNAERQQQVWYTNTHFLTASRFVSKVESKIGSISGLKGKTIVSPAGSTNIKQALEFNSRLNLGMTIIPAQDQAEAFLMVETGRAVAFVQDDIVIAGLIANAKDPKAYVISGDAFSKPEPYGIMLRKDDVAFKAIADAATASLYQSPELAALYAKWFTQPIPPKGVNLDIPMSPAMKRAFEKPTDSPDPSTY
jgi:glutamate/aspartate transport system substrate-binding protein